MVGPVETWNCASERCFRLFPCLSDPGRRSALCLRVALVVLHLVFVGILFLFDKDLIEKTRREPWYTALYLLLFVATLAQYFLTACSSPGYVLDAMKVANEFKRTTMMSKLFNYSRPMVFLCWTRPSPQEQKACVIQPGDFNYESKHRGASAKPASSLEEAMGLLKNGFSLNHARILVGSGLETYEKGKTALQTRRHFGLDWAFVDPKTPIQSGVKFCACVKEFVPWLMMPLQVVYVNENRNTKQAVASFGFGSGTLQGHLLGGEERFSIELDENNQVWYEILSFSKPAHFLSLVGYPYVHLRQKYFAHQSTQAIKKHLSA